MKKRYVIIVVALVVLVAAAAALLVTGVISNPFEQSLTQPAASQKAAEYMMANFPEMKGTPQYSSDDDALTYWEFGYRRDEEVTVAGEKTTLPIIVIIRVDKRSGAIDAVVST